MGREYVQVCTYVHSRRYVHTDSECLIVCDCNPAILQPTASAEAEDAAVSERKGHLYVYAKQTSQWQIRCIFG